MTQAHSPVRHISDAPQNLPIIRLAKRKINLTAKRPAQSVVVSPVRKLSATLQVQKPLEQLAFDDFNEEMLVDQFVERHLEEGKVTIFTSGVKYLSQETDQVKKILTERGIKFQELEVENDPQQYLIKCALNLHKGYTCLPNIYFGQKHIGGLDDLVGISQSETTLKQLLAQNKIISEDGAQPYQLF